YTCDEDYKLFCCLIFLAKSNCGGPPVIPNGKVISQHSNYKPDDSVQIICKEGYSPQVDRLTCLEGKWNSNGAQLRTISTAKICSPPPKVDNAVVVSSYQKEYLSGSERVEYICQNYYIMQGGPFRTCNNGHWTGAIRCLKPCTVDRQLMTRHNIQFKYILGDKLRSTHNGEIEFVCIRGKHHVGTYAMRQRCVDGEMNLPSCQ
uniref:Complement factor H like 4 n=1 Tax=Lates calcarifer TaxID=8187 RepID=A0A4W6F8A1_LATCA